MRKNGRRHDLLAHACLRVAAPAFLLGFFFSAHGHTGNTRRDPAPNCCANGGCNWFTNATELPAGQPATIGRASPLRTYGDTPGAGDWSRRSVISYSNVYMAFYHYPVVAVAFLEVP